MIPFLKLYNLHKQQKLVCHLLRTNRIRLRVQLQKSINKQIVSAYLSYSLRTTKLTGFKKTQDAVMTQVGLSYNILIELATATEPVHTNVIG
jgi:hypothetical protein